MKESEERIHDADLQKAKIRERYKGISPDELDVIPAKPQESLYDDTSEKRVGAYVRVSTDDPRQTTSYELQKNHYWRAIFCLTASNSPSVSTIETNAYTVSCFITTARLHCFCVDVIFNMTLRTNYTISVSDHGFIVFNNPIVYIV